MIGNHCGFSPVRMSKGCPDSELLPYSHHAFEPDYLSELQADPGLPYFAVNNLNRDFVGTKGFSVVFQRSGIGEVERRFPFSSNRI